MFHRVKSETPTDQYQNDSQSPAKPAYAPSTGAAPASPAQTPAPSAAAPAMEDKPKSPYAPPVSQAPVSQPSTTKEDSKPMIYDTRTNASTEDKNEMTATPATMPMAQEQRRPLEIPGSAYAKTSSAPVRVAGSYPGASAYPGAPASSSMGASRMPKVSENARTLTIGSGITMSGEIESCDYLLVEGTVEAALKGASFLEIAESGVFYGTVEIDEATIAGRFEGDITVHGRLTIRSSGVITGSIAYKELEVESGAVIDGRLTPVSALQSEGSKPQSSSSTKASSKTPAPTAKARAQANARDERVGEPANSDGELFAGAIAAAE